MVLRRRWRGVCKHMASPRAQTCGPACGLLLTVGECAAGIWELMQGKREKLEPTLKDAQDETEMVIFDAVENLLKATNTDPQEARRIIDPFC